MEHYQLPKVRRRDTPSPPNLHPSEALYFISTTDYWDDLSHYRLPMFCVQVKNKKKTAKKSPVMRTRRGKGLQESDVHFHVVSDVFLPFLPQAFLTLVAVFIIFLYFSFSQFIFSSDVSRLPFLPQAFLLVL